MLSNVMVQVPKILLEHRLRDLTAALAATAVLGVAAMIVFFLLIRRFAGRSLSEILSPLPKPIRTPFVLFGGAMWFGAGAISLISFVQLTSFYIMRGQPAVLISLLFLAFVVFALGMPGMKILFMVEMSIVLVSPLVLFIFWKTLNSYFFEWDSVGLALKSSWAFPSWETIATAAYLFSGSYNLLVFQQDLGSKLSVHWLWFFSGMGVLTLLTSCFIPIGLHGLVGIGEYSTPWVVTADSIRMAFGPVERMMHIFLLLFLVLTLISVVVHWHVAATMIAAASRAPRWTRLSRPIAIGAFAVAAAIGSHRFTFEEIGTVGRIWMMVRWPSEIVLIGVLMYCAWKLRGNRPLAGSRDRELADGGAST
jgi:hypothetical protein